jgi:PAS domain S-box-containing protein
VYLKKASKHYKFRKIDLTSTKYTTTEFYISQLQEFKKALDESAIVSKTDTRGVITYVNQKFCSISGYERNELIGKMHSIVRHPDTPRATFEELWRVISNGGVFKGNIKNRKKNGEAYYVDTAIVPILNTKGVIAEFLAIRYEVTDLIVARELAVSAERIKSEFLANMSHEVRTPLNAIVGFISVMKKEKSLDKIKTYLDIIESSSRDLMRIVNDVLDFSKMKNGKLPLEVSEFAPVNEFSSQLRLFSEEAFKKKIEFLTFVDPNMPEKMYGDITRIKQVLSNLLSNAVKFTDCQGRVKVSVFYDTAKARLHYSVNDNGIGMDNDAVKRIFRPFEQEDLSTTRKYGGTGLGLAISNELVSHMGGEIDVISKKSVGSTFTVSLPVEHKTSISEYASSKNVSMLYITNMQDDMSPACKLLQKYLYAFGYLEDRKSDEALRASLSSDKQGVCLKIKRSTESFVQKTFVFPLLPDDVRRILSEMLETQHDEKSDRTDSQKLMLRGKVLVAEDNKMNQVLISILLKTYGLEYDIVSDGVEAVQKYTEDGYDLLLFDENMPNMNGLEALKRIRDYENSNAIPKTPAISITANVMAGDKEFFLSSGMDGFVGKPIITSELECALKRFLPTK